MANKPIESSSSSPLNSIKYFASPLTTILESVNDPQNEFITLHDLAEAYATISRRIRLLASEILENDPELPAFEPFKTDNASLSICLTRDIGRCLLNPLTIFSQPQSTSDDGSILEEGTERAQGYATLSHHALVFLSDVFSLTPVMNIFSASQLRDLLREVLLILSNHHLPTPNSKKTWSLAAWILTTQRLPPDVLLSLKQELKNVLTGMLRRDFEGHTHINEGLKLLSTLFRTHFEFIDFLLPLYPPILALSTEDVFDVRMQALKTLRCIVALKLDSPDARWSQQIASQTASFIKSQAEKYKASQEDSLQGILSSAMNDTEGHSNKKGPLWASLMIACLICLSDAHLFTHPHSLKLFLSVLARATGHKRSYVRALHPHVWNCLVWCHSRLPDPSRDPGTKQAFGEIRKRAFLVLRQELKGGIATALIASLLSSPSFKISDVLSIVKDLLSGSRETQVREGIKILARLVSGVGLPPAAGPPNDIRDLRDIVFRDLFVGTFLDLPEDQIKVLSSRLPSPDDRFIRPLPEVQIRENWKEFLQLWVHGVNRAHAPNMGYKQHEHHLLNIWQALLLAQSQLAPNSALLSMSPSTAKQLTSTLTSFITRTDDTARQLHQLNFVQKLWSVIKQSYDVHRLDSLAESVLSTILRQKYNLDEEEVKATWSTLCAELAPVCIPNLLPSLFAGNRSQEGIEVQRQLWVTIASSGVFETQESGWEEALSFLLVPLRFWSLDLQELDIWTKVFNEILGSAKGPATTPGGVVNMLLHKLGSAKIKDLQLSPGVVSVLLPHFRFKIDDASHRDLLLTVDRILAKLYPPAPEDLILATPILAGVAHLVGSSREKDTFQLLSLLKDGLCAWIGDETKSLLEHEHDILVRDIYCASLTRLSKLSPSAELLQDLSLFLSSAFERIGHPPIGPLAFEHFWRATYHHQPESLKRLIPDNLNACLKAWSDHCGDSLAEGVPSIIDSQDTPKSIIPDSQLPRKAAPAPSEVDLSCAMDSDEIYDLVLPSSDHVPVDLEVLQNTTPPRATTPKASLQRQRTRDENELRDGGDDVEIGLNAGESKQLAGTKRPSFQSLSMSSLDEGLASPGNPKAHKRRRTGDNYLPMVEYPKPFPEPGPIAHYGTEGSEPLSRSTIFPFARNRTPRTPRTPDHKTHRRTVSPRPQGLNEELIPESSSARSLVQGLQQDKGKSRTTDVGRIEDEIVDDSVEMEYLPSPLPRGSNLHNPRLLKSSPAKRLQSEPLIESGFPSRPTPLRRNHTTHDRLGALERAYTLVSETQGASQVPIEELAHAARLAHEIGAKLTAQLSKKLRKAS